MRRIHFVLAFIFVSYFAGSQEITFTFTSEHICSYEPLDSILIENVTLGCDTVLYFPDTVLSFTHTGIRENTFLFNEFKVKQNYPNPFNDITYIQILTPEKDVFSLNVYDLLGREIISVENLLEKGINNFEFKGGSSQNYVLVASSTKYLDKILMIKTGGAKNTCPHLKYLDYSNIEQDLVMTKNYRSYFNYNIGNSLRFIGFIDDDDIIIEDIPVESADYIFSFYSTAPSQPSAITGEDNICMESPCLIYSVNLVENVTYFWTIPDGWNILNGQNTNEITVSHGDMGGSISVYASNNCGNSSQQSIFINIASLNVEVTSNSPLCENETVHLYASDAENWAWSGVNEFESNSQNPEFLANINSSGTYSVTLTDEFGCTFSSETNIIVNENPTPIITSNSPVCTNETVSLSVDQGALWDWSGPNGFESDLQEINISSPSLADNGTYAVTVMDVNGCTGSSATDVIINEQPNISLSSNSPICDSETLELYASLGTIWNWVGPNGFESELQNPMIINSTNLNSGNYYATITDENNCTNNDSIFVNVSVPNVPIASEHISGEDYIIYNWLSSDNCNGYKINTIDDYGTAIDNGVDTTFQLTDLDCGENIYNLYIWAYNSCGHSVAIETSMYTQLCFECGNTITDIDGNIYNTVQIGAQCWMNENLKTTHYNDGENIPNITSGTEWSNLISGAWCYYNNNSSYNLDYGKLYNYYSVATNKLCPEGWVIPQGSSLQTQQDGWFTLTAYLISNGYNYDGSLTGNKIAKSLASNEDWDLSSNEGAIGNDLSANNSSGFNGYPGSYRYTNGQFSPDNGDIHKQASWWTGSQYQYKLYFESEFSLSYQSNMKNGYSVRCMRPCTLPNNPIEGEHTSTYNQITWNWSSGDNTIGFKYLLDDDSSTDYTDAIDIGNTTSLSISGLHCETNYTLSLWAYNECGSSIVAEYTFSTTPVDCPETLTDVDGNIYNTVIIDCQCWMAENLKYLPSVVPSSVESTTASYYYVYGYNGTNVTSAKSYTIGSTNIFETYGVLYNKRAALGACPTDWHLPTDDEWTILSNYLAENGYNYDGSLTPTSATDQTKRLKIGKSMASTDYWNSSTWTGGVGNDISLNNQSELNMRPAGIRRSITNQFESIKSSAYFWTSSSDWMRYLDYLPSALYRGEETWGNGYSVRCLKDN